VTTTRSLAARKTATAVAIDIRTLGVVVLNVVLLGLAVILTAGAEWLSVP